MIKQKHKSLKISWNANGTKGRLRFKFLGLQTQFNSVVKGREQIEQYKDRVAVDIKHLENVSIDPNTQESKYPYTVWQIGQIEATGHKLLPEILQAFTINHSFRNLWDQVQPNGGDNFNGGRFDTIAFLDKDINLITGKEIAELFKSIGTWSSNKTDGKAVAETTMSKAQKAVREVFIFANENSILVQDPFNHESAVIKKYQISANVCGKKTYWSFEQIEFILQAARWFDQQGFAFQKMELYVRLGLFTGARDQDLREATWSELSYLDTEQARWSFKQRKHAKKPGFVATDKYLVEIDDFSEDLVLLRQLQAAAKGSNSEHIITKANGEQMKRGDMYKLFQKVLARANLLLVASDINAEISSDVDPVEVITGSAHHMRHTMVAHVVSGSEGMWDVAAKRCGHANVSITINTYGDMMGHTVKQGLARKNAFVSEQTEAAKVRVQRLMLRAV